MQESLIFKCPNCKEQGFLTATARISIRLINSYKTTDRFKTTFWASDEEAKFEQEKEVSIHCENCSHSYFLDLDTSNVKIDSSCECYNCTINTDY